MKNKILDFLFNLNVVNKILLVVIVDYLALFLAWAFFVIFPEYLFQSLIRPIHLMPFSIAFIFYFSSMWFFGGYREIYRSFSLKSVFPVVGSVFLLFVATNLLLRLDPYSIGSFYNTVSKAGSIASLGFLLIVGSRISFRFLVESSETIGQNKIIIYGIGRQAKELYSSITFDPETRVIGFISEDKNSLGRELHGVPILSIKRTKKILEKDNSIMIYLTNSKIPISSRSSLIDFCAKNDIGVKTVAPYSKLLRDENISLQDLSISDIIPRDNLDHFDNELNFLNNKNILISGAGGSIGSEIARLVSKCNIKKLIILDISEFALFSISEELKEINKDLEIYAVLIDIKNTSKLEDIINQFKPDIIYHSAAYKHVPLLEEKFNFEEAFENNFFATCSFVDIAVKCKIDQFVFVSTDKAVRPTNLMGASKRLSEIYLQKLNQCTDTDIIAVRFGNVMDSSGSVLQTFRRQIKNGGPLTVTHPEVNRYFMTIGEAAYLVIMSSFVSSSNKGKNGIYMLKMGNPAKILEIAKRMISLSGNKVKSKEHPNGIEIAFTGLRPGEKLYEELLINENDLETEHPKIFLDTSNHVSSLEEFNSIKKSIKSLIEKNDVEALKVILKEHAEYNPTKG